MYRLDNIFLLKEVAKKILQSTVGDVLRCTASHCELKCKRCTLSHCEQVITGLEVL